jgi:hypothetical protein
MAKAAARIAFESSGKCNRIALVREFVRELEVLYRLQETAKKELAEDSSGQGKLMTSVRMRSRTLLQMNDSLNRLDMISVAGQWAEFRDLLKELHQHQMSKTMLAGPEPGVNYGKLVARAPELTAQMEQIDKSIFDMSQAMFFALVDDERVEADGNLHHLILTKKDRTSMVHAN